MAARPTQLQLLRREFMHQLSSMMMALGFHRSDQQFYRKTAYGMNMIRLTFVSHPGINFEAELAIGVAHAEVERLFHELVPDYPKDIARWTWTIGNRLDNMFRDPINWKWPVSNEKDLGHAISSITHVVQTVAFPYFERFSSLEEVLRVISKKDDESWRLYLGEIVPLHAIVTAYILDRRDVFKQIIQLWTSHLQQLANSDNPQYVRLVGEFWAHTNELSNRWDERSKTARP